MCRLWFHNQVRPLYEKAGQHHQNQGFVGKQAGGSAKQPLQKKRRRQRPGATPGKLSPGSPRGYPGDPGDFFGQHRKIIHANIDLYLFVLRSAEVADI